MADKIALVTGGGKRLGAKIVEGLAEDGWHVLIHYNESGEEADALKQRLTDNGGSAEICQLDLENSAQVADFVRKAGRIDALINSASLFEMDRPEDVGPDMLERMMRVNLMAPVLLASQMAKAHEGRASGCVINVLDQKLFNLNPDFFSYTLSKYALLGATQTMAMALAPRVRVNAVAPGITLPSGGQSVEEFERAHSLNPMQGGSTPDDIVRTVRFILATPSMTGETIIVDGGQHLDARPRDVMYAPGIQEDR